MSTRAKISKAMRELVYEKYQGHCAYCGKSIEYNEMQIDHKMSLRKGGAENKDNYLPSCRSCNRYKHTYDIEQFRKAVMTIPSKLLKRNSAFAIAVRMGIVTVPDTSDFKFYFERAERKTSTSARNG